METWIYKKRKRRKSIMSLRIDATILWHKLFSHARLPEGDWGSCELCISYIEKKCPGGKDPVKCVIGRTLKGESIYG